MAAHPRQQSAILGSDCIQVPPAAQEVVVDQSDHVEAVSDAPRIREVLADDGTIHRR
jgi:hypothetical protein